MVDKDVQFEILSALLGGADVKPLGRRSTETALTFEKYISTAICADGSKREFFVDMDTFFDPKFDFDFTKMSSGQQCTRGGEDYNRPIGWYRIALKVKDKYPDGNTWLGPDGWRNESAPGEWPVVFHGTTLDGAKGIIQSNYKAGDRQLYGRGVYSTPYLSTATSYTKKFTSKKNGKTYRVIMQNRINPEEREPCNHPKYWLIRIPENLNAQQERKKVERALRPYGILIQEVQNSESEPEPESSGWQCTLS